MMTFILQSNTLFSNRRQTLSEARVSLLLAAHAQAVAHDLVYLQPSKPTEIMQTPVSTAPLLLCGEMG